MPSSDTQYRPKPPGEALAAAPICCRFDVETTAWLQAHPDRSGFLRQAVTQARAAGGRTLEQLVPQVFALAAELEAAAPGRSFAPDGHMLGSIGEAIAADRYGLKLTTASTKGVDAHAPSGQPVEIKCTGAKTIALRGAATWEPGLHLLALVIAPDGTAETIYNGPAALVWASAGKLRDNGQRQISVTKLRALQTLVPSEQQLLEVG